MPNKPLSMFSNRCGKCIGQTSTNQQQSEYDVLREEAVLAKEMKSQGLKTRLCWQNENERKKNTLKRAVKNKNPIQTNSSAQLIGISHSSTAKDDTAILFSCCQLFSLPVPELPPKKDKEEKQQKKTLKKKREKKEVKRYFSHFDFMVFLLLFSFAFSLSFVIHLFLQSLLNGSDVR